jgi:hypothetical protein
VIPKKPGVTGRHDRPVRLQNCTGYIEYPFENKLEKSCLEDIASDVEKEEKIV